MKNMYEIDGGIIDLSEIQSVSDVRKLSYKDAYGFYISSPDLFFNFKTLAHTCEVRNKLIEAIKELPEIAEPKTWIVSEWKQNCQVSDKVAGELYCIETGERREI